MPVRIDHRSPVPPYEQVRAQLSLDVSSGRLRPGDRLATIRDLAAQLGVANGTVARAYRELDYAGIVTMRGRAGTFVAEEPPVAFAVAERRERLDAAATAFVQAARDIGVPPSDALEVAAAAFRRQEHSPGQP